MIRHVELFGGWNHVYSGDVIPPSETVFLIANHRFWLDWMTIMSFAGTTVFLILVLVIFHLFLIESRAARRNRLGCSKYFAKKVIMYFPGFGWGMYLADMVFLSRDWMSDSAHITQTFKNLKDSQSPFWITSHLEGTRFSVKKQKLSDDFAKKAGRKPLKYCLIPRTKGFVATVEGLRSVIDAVYDVTIVYDHQKYTSPSWSGLVLSKWLVRPIDVHLHIRRFPVKDVCASSHSCFHIPHSFLNPSSLLIRRSSRSGCTRCGKRRTLCSSTSLRMTSSLRPGASPSITSG